jgi:hypothetical protein
VRGRDLQSKTDREELAERGNAWGSILPAAAAFSALVIAIFISFVLFASDILEYMHQIVKRKQYRSL